MGVVRLGRRSFGLVVAVLLSVALYFQAAGAAELVVARTLFEPRVATPGAVRQGSPRAPAARRSTSGDAILALNPFDSVTGPLARGASALAKIPGATQPSADLDDPLNAPPCPGVSVSIVTQSTDPQWSIAQLAGPGDADASARRVGDRVGQLEVLYIGFDSARLSPAVWLSSDENLCHVLLFGEKRDEAAASDTLPPVSGTRAPAEDERRRNRSPRASSAAALPPGIADRIQKISETEFAIDRSVIDDVLENQAQLIASTRIVPEQRDGKTIGVRLFGIRSDTLLGTLGLQDGDRLESINGHDVATPATALEAYAGLPTASSINVRLTRRGQPTTLEIQIR